VKFNELVDVLKLLLVYNNGGIFNDADV